MVPFAFGNAMGRAGEPDNQHRTLKAALDLLERREGPVLEEIADATVPEILLQSTTVATKSSSTGTSLNPADELTGLRGYYERWVAAHGGRTAVGLSRIPQRRFRGIIRFLEGYSVGETTDSPDRPAEISTEQFIRHCVDDLKAFYYEARMNQRPSASEKELHEWFWGETALATLVANLSRRIGESDDPHIKSIAYGLAR